MNLKNSVHYGVYTCNNLYKRSSLVIQLTLCTIILSTLNVLSNLLLTPNLAKPHKHTLQFMKAIRQTNLCMHLCSEKKTRYHSVLRSYVFEFN